MNEEKQSGVEGIYWNENVSARPNGLREKADTEISCRGPGPTRNKRYTCSLEKEEVAKICARVAQSRTWLKYVPVWHNNGE